MTKANLPKGRDAKPEVYSGIICQDSSVAKKKKGTSLLCLGFFSYKGEFLNSSGHSKILNPLLPSVVAQPLAIFNAHTHDYSSGYTPAITHRDTHDVPGTF